MLVSVVIINYNTLQLTCNCIESVIRCTKDVSYEIVVVDNASPDRNAGEILKRYPTVKLIESDVNGGFAKGNNLGIANASGDIILLLNSDTILTEDSISKTAEALLRNEHIGAITAKLVYDDGKYQSNARKFRSIRNELLDLARPLLMLLPYPKRAAIMLNQYFKGDFNTYCDWVSGAYMMFRRKLIDKLDGQKLDERFFMYGEDHLWGVQIQELGYKNYFLSETTVIHIANASTEPAKQLKLLKTMLSRELEIIQYRYGKSLYYYVFKLLFTTKENIRYIIKVAAYKLMGKRIR